MPLRLFVVFACTIALASCSHGNGSKPEAASTAIVERTGIAAVDGAIDGELRGDGNTLQRLLRYSSVPCAVGSNGQNVPACRPGEKDGSPVEVLPIGGCSRSFQRPDEFREDGITGEGVRLYAVYHASTESFPQSKYVVVFLRRFPSESAYALAMTDEGITGYHNGCEQTAEQFVASQHLSSTIINPPSAPPPVHVPTVGGVYRGRDEGRAYQPSR
jgi:hypothetical protein